MSPSVRYNADAIEVRVCAHCDREWPLDTSMEQLAVQDDNGVYHAAGPFCPSAEQDRCAVLYQRAKPTWWASR